VEFEEVVGLLVLLYKKLKKKKKKRRRKKKEVYILDRYLDDFKEETLHFCTVFMTLLLYYCAIHFSRTDGLQVCK
jgi:hypothetical protein